MAVTSIKRVPSDLHEVRSYALLRCCSPSLADWLAVCAVAVLLCIVMLRFLPVLIAVILACMLFWWLLKKAAIHIGVN